jgi:deoxycytidylate deaminase
VNQFLSGHGPKDGYASCATCHEIFDVRRDLGYLKPADPTDPFSEPMYVCHDCACPKPTNGIAYIDRPTWEDICMGIAVKLSQRSRCNTPNRQVGCVITTSDHSSILAWGYNGGAAGDKTPCDYDPDVEKGSRCQCAHAEMNALTKLNANGHKDLIMYVTLQPCKLCATLMVNAKCFKEVVYLSEYRDNRPVFTLRAAGIQVRKSAYEDT